jgi:hypothetical protein
MLRLALLRPLLLLSALLARLLLLRLLLLALAVVLPVAVRIGRIGLVVAATRIRVVHVRIAGIVGHGDSFCFLLRAGRGPSPPCTHQMNPPRLRPFRTGQLVMCCAFLADELEPGARAVLL